MQEQKVKIGRYYCDQDNWYLFEENVIFASLEDLLEWAWANGYKEVYDSGVEFK